MIFDYRKLLLAYIKHIGDMEGIDYMTNVKKLDWLSEEETAEIANLCHVAYAKQEAELKMESNSK